MIIDKRGRQPVLLVADRCNRRLQKFTLDGKHARLRRGNQAPCHFSDHKEMVIPDLYARVTVLDKKNKVIAHLGDIGPDSWKPLRTWRAKSSRPGNSSARTAHVSITRATSSSPNGSKSGASPSSGGCDAGAKADGRATVRLDAYGMRLVSSNVTLTPASAPPVATALATPISP